MFCPTQDDNRAALLALTPRGRAWRNNDGGPEPTSVIYKFWDAAAAVFTFLTDRLCALRLEMFCQTKTETTDLWMQDYGLPDACDPFPDLCTKVAAIGGTRCEYYTEVAARAGWTIDCEDEGGFCGGQAGCFQAGCSFPGSVEAAKIKIIVDLGESPAFGGPFNGVAYAGCFGAGSPLGCYPDISGLKCIMERIVHAEVEVDYVTIAPPIYIMADASTHIMDNTGALLVAE